MHDIKHKRLLLKAIKISGPNKIIIDIGTYIEGRSRSGRGHGQHAGSIIGLYSSNLPI